MKKSFYYINIFNSCILIATIYLFCYAVYHFAINIPMWDDYETSLDFLNLYASSYSLTDKLFLLVKQINEHRIVMTELIVLLYHKLWGFINFRYLSFIGDTILILCVIPIYCGLIHVLPKNIKSKTISYAILIFIVIMLLSFSQWKAFVWVGASLQQYSQFLFSLMVILLVDLYLSKNKSVIILIYTTLTILNGFTGGGWISLFMTTTIFFILRKQYRLLLWNFILYGLVALCYFYLLPYDFIHREHPSIYEYIRFIIGFSGSVYFTNKVSYFVGIIIVLCNVSSIKIIIKHNILLLWYLFFYINALLIGISRAGLGIDYGLNSHYSIYSAVNIVFTVITLYLYLLNNHKYYKYSKYIVYVPFISFTLFMVSYCKNTSINSELFQWRANGTDGVFFYDYKKAEQIYKKSQQFGIYQSFLLEKNIDKIKSNITPVSLNIIINNSKVEASLDGIDIFKDKLYHVSGWCFIPDIKQNGFKKYLIINGNGKRYVFGLVDTRRRDVSRFFNQDLDYTGFDGYISTQLIKSGKYDISLYVTNGKLGAIKQVKTDVSIN